MLATRTVLLAVQEPAVRFGYAESTISFEATATTREPRFRVFAKATGAPIRELERPANAGGAPMTYALDGRQYVVVPVGGGGLPAELVAVAVEPPPQP